MTTLPQFRLPDLLAQWPWPRKLNQHYQEAKSKSDKWLRDFKALDAKSQRSFDFCNFREDSFLLFAFPVANRIFQHFLALLDIHYSIKVRRVRSSNTVEDSDNLTIFRLSSSLM